MLLMHPSVSSTTQQQNRSDDETHARNGPHQCLTSLRIRKIDTSLFFRHTRLWQAHLEESSQSQGGRQPVGLRGKVCLSGGHHSISQPCGGNIHLHTKAHVRLQKARTASLKSLQIAGAPDRVSYTSQYHTCRCLYSSSLDSNQRDHAVDAAGVKVRRQALAMHDSSSKLAHDIWAHAQQSCREPQHEVHNAKCACALATWWTQLVARTSDLKLTAASSSERTMTATRHTRVCNEIPQQGASEGPSAASTLPAPKQQQACPRCLQAWPHAEC